MTTIDLQPVAGAFAEDKDVARNLRIERLAPALANRENVEIDFANVALATQSFIHALLSDVIRRQGASVLDRITFTNCNPTIQGLIEIVVEYSQQNGDEARTLF